MQATFHPPDYRPAGLVNLHNQGCMPNTPLGRIVQARRKLREQTQTAFADAVGISQSLVNDIENGEDTSKIRAVTLLKLADYLNLHPRFLLTGTGPHQWSAADSEQEERLLSAFRELTEVERAELVGRAEGLVAGKAKPSRADPFKGVPLPEQDPPKRKLRVSK